MTKKLIEYDVGYVLARRRWKYAAKLLYQALEKSRKRCRRLQCRLDDQYESSRDELQRLRVVRDRLLGENTRLVNEMLDMRQR
jgi:DNA anti-recombination protein RmuC